MSDDRKSLQQALRDTWMSALGVLSGAEAEIAKTAHRLIESVGGEASGAAKEFVERVKKNREAFEHRVEEGVKAAVARAHKPIAKELQSLRDRIEAVQKRVEELARKRHERGHGRNGKR